MSDAKPNERVVAYLTQQLGYNPARESEAILALRSRALRLKAGGAPAAAAPESARPFVERAPVAAKLESIRSRAFTEAADKLNAELNALPLATFPDLQILARRIGTVLASRARLPALTQQRGFDGDFFSVFKQVLTLPPHDVGLIREQVVASFHRRDVRRRGQAMIKLLRDQVPQLYELERDWFESLLRYRSAASAPVRAASDGGQRTSNTWLIWILIAVVSGGVRACSSLNRPASEGRQGVRTSSNYYQSPPAQRPAHLLP